MGVLKYLVFVVLSIFLGINPAFSYGFQEGVRAYSQKNYALAESLFRQAILTDPNNIKLRYYLAISMVQNKKYEEAKYNYRYILEASPDSEVGYLAGVGLNIINGSSASLINRSEIHKTEFAYEGEGSAIIVKDVVINGAQRANFIMDTGATYTLISTELANKLGINTANAPRVNMVTINGKVSAAKVILDSIEVNGLKVRNIPATVCNFETNGNSKGLLGLSFLRHLKVTIDRPSQKVILEK